MTLDPADIEAIAQRVAELLADRMPEPAGARLIDAAHVARLLGVERDWVYAHASQLGAIRLGGPRGRLRFDRAQITARADRTRDAPAAAPRRSSRTRRTRGDGRPTTPGADHLHSAAQTYNKVGRGRRSNAFPGLDSGSRRPPMPVAKRTSGRVS